MNKIAAPKNQKKKNIQRQEKPSVKSHSGNAEQKSASSADSRRNEDLLKERDERCPADGALSRQSMIPDIPERTISEKALLHEKNKLRSILDAMNSGITIRSTEYDLIYQNDYSLRAFGNHVGEKCYGVFAGLDGVCDGCPVEKAFKDGQSHTHVKEAEMPSGEITYWENTAVPMKDITGSIYACLEVNTNITERRKAELALSESEAALRNSKRDLQRLAGRLISAQEDELRRLSRELHDDLTQRLAVIAITAGKLERDLSSMPAAYQETLQVISEMKDQLIKVSEDVHAISRQLHPTILDDLGLVRAIEAEIVMLTKQNNIDIVFETVEVPAAVPKDAALCLYRIVQEGLNNIVRHSKARDAEIFLEGTDRSICLTIRDNGIGFDPAQTRLQPGIGLASMYERVQLVRGDFSILSRPGEGTVINVCVPLTGDEV